jgi:(p)ppGpp synthase/HD superfamily hydrolase
MIVQEEGVISMSTLEKAIALAAEAHAGQVDKAGAPYIPHPLRVKEERESIV